MKLPWKNQELEEEKDRLEKKIEEQDEQIDKLQNILEAEKERRSSLARKKQEAEEELNRLKDRIEGLKQDKEKDEQHVETEFEELRLEAFKDSLKKLGKIMSDKDDLVTIFSPEKLSQHSDISSIQNSIPEETLRPLMDEENLVLLYSENLGSFCFRL
ncbi:MAG: hypothetical protein V5A72_00630, partial [Candidatus Nanohaloarchaea archaeon]